MVAEREIFFHKNDHANFYGGKTYNEAFWTEYYLRVRETKMMLNFVHVDILVVESKGL